MTLNKREKVYETVVNARIDACYMLVRELTGSRDYRIDFGTSPDMSGANNTIVLSILPGEAGSEDHGPLNLPVGTVEFLRLTEEKTLFQVFLGAPHWSVLDEVGAAPGASPAIDRISKDAPNYVEAVWLGILGRFRALQLVPSYRVSVGD